MVEKWADPACFDLIVCGAGPAGAVAAAQAARDGLRVAMVEKKRFPRHKPCGGGMPATVGTELARLVPEAISDCQVRHMRHTWNFGEACLAPIDPGVKGAAAGSGNPAAVREVDRTFWMVQRPRFDHALVQAAVAAGAEFLEGWELKGFTAETDRLALRLRQRGSGREQGLGAAYLIGADGAAGVVSRAAGLRRSPRITMGVEVEVPHRWDPANSLLRPDTLHLEYGAVRHGYCWVFPKADHLNIGAGVFYDPRRDVRRDPHMHARLVAAIEAYAASIGVADRLAGQRFHAHPLPVWRGREPLQSADGRVLLAGDAAGLINPLFGDGLLHAIRSGRLAAIAVATGNTRGYTCAVHDLLADDFEAARRLSWLLRLAPQLTYRYGLSDPRVTVVMARMLAGELAFRGLARRALGRIAAGLIGRPPLPPKARETAVGP